jgi:CDP-diacylglycerol---serine O-phosphatidyltransferase
VARVWRRRRSSDLPRPAGRRWARLRQGGSRATHLLARVTRRHREPAASMLVGGEQVVYPRTDRAWRRIGVRRTVGAQAGRGSGPATRSPGLDHTVVRRAAPVALLPGERTTARRVKFALANSFTVGSLVLGMSAAFLAIHGNLTLAAACLLGCVVVDGLDGGIARTFGVASPFGAQMDSLADLSSFGVATGIVVYEWLVAGSANPAAAAVVCVLVTVCAAIRLARFNVSPCDGRYFRGVPTTMTAAVLTLDTLLAPDVPIAAQVVLVGVFAVGMVSPFPYAKIASVKALPLWLWVFPAICSMISVPATFVGLVSLYLVSGPAMWLRERSHAPRLHHG